MLGCRSTGVIETPKVLEADQKLHSPVTQSTELVFTYSSKTQKPPKTFSRGNFVPTVIIYLPVALMKPTQSIKAA